MKIQFITFWLLSMISLLATGCKTENSSTSAAETEDRAESIVSKSIRQMGGQILDNAEVHFTFRDQSLSYYKREGQFRFTRTFRDTASYLIADTLTNRDFIRYKNGQKLDLKPEKKESLKGGVNSIVYFAFLPYRLNDPAVNKEYIGTIKIKDKKYEKVKVTFTEEGGGTDHEDTYYYYFDPEDFSLDYLAYDFHVDGGGIRFRAGYNERTIHGLTVRDYVNYAADPDSVDYDRIEEYYNNDALRELSRIELDNFSIETLPKS